VLRPLLGPVAAAVDHCVAVVALQRREVAVAIDRQAFGRGEKAGVGAAAVGQRHRMPRVERGLHYVAAEEACAAEDQQLHGRAAARGARRGDRMASLWRLAPPPIGARRATIVPP
jgi:hypothetical protein